MKRFFAMVKNENIKTMKQTSYRVLLIIFAVIILAVPIISKLISSLSAWELDEDYEWYLIMSEDYQESGDKAHASYYRSIYEAEKYLADHEIKSGSPAYNYYGYEFESLYTARECTKEIHAGNISVEEAQNVFYDYPDKYYQYYAADASESDCILDPNAWEKYDESYDWEEFEAIRNASWEMENIEKADAIFAAKLEELEDSLLNFDLMEYYKEQAENTTAAVKNMETEVEIRRKAYEADPQDEDLAYAVKQAEFQLESLRNQERGTQLQVEKFFDFEGWERAVFDNVIVRASLRLPNECILISKDAYKERYGEYNLDEFYEKYKKNIEKELKTNREAVTIGFYSIENDIPLPGAIPGGSVKNEIRDQIGTIVTITSLIMIVLAGSTLSNEYSSGTIRLLLIRPRKRSKILGAKIVSMVMLWIAAIVIALIISSALDIILFGFGDVFVPDLNITDKGVVTVTPSIVGGLEILASNMLSTAVLIFMALLLSTLVHRAALSIALPLVIQTVIGIVQKILLALIPTFDKLHFLVYTPLPYSDLTVFRTVSAAEQMIGKGSFSEILDIFGTGMLEGFYPVLGAVYLAAFTALFIGLSFLSFTKQQIKN